MIRFRPILDKIVNSDLAQSLGDQLQGLNALRSIYNTLANIDTEGLERYIRISNAIMEPTVGLTYIRQRTAFIIKKF